MGQNWYGIVQGIDIFVQILYNEYVAIDYLLIGGTSMINLEELKPILEMLVEGREDSASIIEQVQGIDHEVEDVQPQIDKAVAEAVAKSNAEWNARYMKAFFGDKAETMSPDAIDTPAEEPIIDEEVDEYADIPTVDEIIAGIENGEEPEKKEEED